MRQSLILGNWKMNGRLNQVVRLVEDLLAIEPHPTVASAILVPAIFLPEISQLLQGKSLGFGAQNVYPKDYGPYTGELSGPMLTDYACQYVLVGHSERRRLFHEEESFVAEKFHHVKEHGMIPILCVGETVEERSAGLTEQILRNQLLAVFEQASPNVLSGCVLAYEPVWAIGTGKTATPEQAQSVHAFMRNLLTQIIGADAMSLPIVYGGSVTATNARALFAMPDIDGGLIGGASLDAQQFGDIIRCIS